MPGSQQQTEAGAGAGAQEGAPVDVVKGIDEAARQVPLDGVAGAAMRSMLISAVVVGAVVWLARMFLGRRRGPQDEKKG